MLRSAAWLRRRRHVTVTTTASTRVMTATQTTSDMNSVDSLLVDAATGWNLSLILSNSSDASAAELLSPALESSSAKHNILLCMVPVFLSDIGYNTLLNTYWWTHLLQRKTLPCSEYNNNFFYSSLPSPPVFPLSACDHSWSGQSQVAKCI